MCFDFFRTDKGLVFEVPFTVMGLSLFVIIALLVKFSAIPDAICSFGMQLQFQCTQLAPPSEHQEIYRALVCGTPVHNPSVLEVFRNTGLIHILVVSGAHLHWCQQLLRWLPSTLFVPAFILYAFATGFAAPVARSFWQIALCWKTGRRFSLPVQVAICGAWTWALTPIGQQELSLQLSWACAILLGFCSICRWKSPLTSCCVIFAGLYPLLSQFQPTHPGSIVMNLFFVGMFSTIVFPLSALSFVIHPLTPLTDFLWSGLLESLRQISPFMEGVWQNPAPHIPSGWIYLVTLQSLFYWTDLAIRRRKK